MNLMGGGDAFGSMQAAPSFPSYIAFEDNVIQLGYDFKRDPSAHNTHIISGYIKNKTGASLNTVNMKIAVQKYMNLNMKPASGTSLGAYAQDLS